AHACVGGGIHALARGVLWMVWKYRTPAHLDCAGVWTGDAQGGHVVSQRIPERRPAEIPEHCGLLVLAGLQLCSASLVPPGPECRALARDCALRNRIRRTLMDR